VARAEDLTIEITGDNSAPDRHHTALGSFVRIDLMSTGLLIYNERVKISSAHYLYHGEIVR